MHENFYKMIMEESPCGYALHRVVCSQKDTPIDYEYLEINPAFTKHTELKRSEIIGKKMSEVAPEMKSEWLNIYGEIAINGGKKDFRQFSEALNRWYKVTVYSPEKYYFVTFLKDITKEVKELQEKNIVLSVLNDIVFELDGNFVFTNALTSREEHLFVPKEKLISSHISEVLPEEFANILIEKLKKSFISRKKEIYEYKSIIPDEDKWYQAEIHYTEIHFKGKYIVSIKDITEKKNIEEVLKNNEEKYRLLTENISDVIWVFNTDRDRFTYVSPSIETLRGFTVEEAISHTFQESLAQESFKMLSGKMSTWLKNFIKSPETFGSKIVEVQQSCKNNEIIWVELSLKYRYNLQNEIEIVGVSRNAVERKNIENKIRYLSYRDQLTGVYNRHYFDEIIKRLIEKSDRYKTPLSMIVLDLDNFKKVNDNWGHPVGDIVLKEAAAIINNTIRKSDVLVRIGGEEFGILMPETNRSGALKVAEKIRENLEKNIYPTAGKVTASLGVAERIIFEPFKDFYARTDEALYQAKKYGKNQTVFYEVKYG